jgi:predicted membrane channel-forming protein YqfA (hemolysin III family)
MLAGGLLFSLRAVVYITRRPDFVPGAICFQEVWHPSIILGCLSLLIVMGAHVAPAGAIG